MTIEIIIIISYICRSIYIAPKLCDLRMSQAADFSFMCVNKIEVTQIPTNYKMPLPFPSMH